MADEQAQPENPDESPHEATGREHPAEQAVDSAAAAAAAVSEAFTPPPLAATAVIEDNAPAGMKLLDDVMLDVKVELGRTRMYVEDVLRLCPESIIELDKAAGDPVDIYVNGRHVARGEVLVLNENFCVRVSELVESGAEE